MQKCYFSLCDNDKINGSDYCYKHRYLKKY